MSDNEGLSLTLTSLGTSRPRPRRNHKPSTPRLLSPSCDYLPSLFDDEQLAAFFPSAPAADTGLPSPPSSAPSVLKSNHSIYRYPSVTEETKEVEALTAPADDVEERREEERRMEVEEGEGPEARREKENGGNERARREEEEEREGNDGARREEEKNREGCDTARVEEKGREDDCARKEDEGVGDDGALKEKRVEVEEGGDKARREKERVIRYSSTDDEVFNDLDNATRGDAPIGQAILAEAPPDSPLSFPLSPCPNQTGEASQQRRWTRPTCSTPDSIPNSTYTTDDAAPMEILSSPQSVVDEDEDQPNTFVFPPKILVSRLGSIYSNLGFIQSGGDSSSSDSGSDTCETLPKEVSLDTESQKEREKGYVLDQKHEWSREFDWVDEGTTGSALTEVRNSHSSSRSSLGSLRASGSECMPWLKEAPETHDGRRPHDSSHAAEDEAENEVSVIFRRKTAQKGDETNAEGDGNRTTGSSSFKPAANEHCGQAKKVPPAKPPRLRASVRTKNSDEKRRSREDPVRYKKVSSQGELSSKRSSSMDNILEAMDERCSQPSRSSAREMTGLLQTPTEAHGYKRERRSRSSFKYKEAAKIVSSIISKKPPFAPLLHRKENLRHKGHSPKKMPCKDVEPSPPSSPTAAEDQRQEAVASKVSEPPDNTPSKDFVASGSSSLDKAQTTCSSHGALLHFYCVKCRVVVCRDCTVVAHSHAEKHKVLDTLDSLAMLRSEAVEMLRHYTILEAMHAALKDIYRKFKLQHRDIDITAMRKRLNEGEYLAKVVKEAESMVTTWTNLQKIRECVSQWEARRDEWGDLVFLASRCALLTNMNIPSDTVFLRMGSWIMPTPWIQLSHLLQPCLMTSTASQTLSSPSNANDKQLTPSSHRKALDLLSPNLKRNGSPYAGRSSTGGTDQPFPYNARQMVLSNLIPYIILNPDIRYFVHVGGPRDVDMTLVVVPVDDHAHDCLKQRRNNATKSPEELCQANYRPPTDAITLVEQQMMCGSCKTRITASYMPLGPSSAPAIVKVSFSDVKVVSDGQGLPVARDGVKRGNVIVDLSSSGRPTLTVVVRDMADFPALLIGQVTWGMDCLTCLVGTDDTKRTESSGFRAKIRATVKREEEAVYDVMFGMDL